MLESLFFFNYKTFAHRKYYGTYKPITYNLFEAWEVPSVLFYP